MTKEFFKITSTCKDDMKHVLPGRVDEIDKLDEDDMTLIASKLADDYCEQLYWGSLRILLENYLDGKKKEI